MPWGILLPGAAGCFGDCGCCARVVLVTELGRRVVLLPVRARESDDEPQTDSGGPGSSGVGSR